MGHCHMKGYYSINIFPFMFFQLIEILFPVKSCNRSFFL